MKKVSFQGKQLSDSERRNLELQAKARGFLNEQLRASVEQTIAVVEQRKQQGVKPEKVWFLVREERGTPCFAELFGY